MPAKEAQARIKINRLLEAAGWRFFDDENGPANIQLELYSRLTRRQLDEMGADFEKTRKGFLDFLLLDERGIPLVVLEAKREDLNPLGAKEQARRYAKTQDCRFVILSNGNLHYFWDLERATRTPSPTSRARSRSSATASGSPTRRRLWPRRWATTSSP